MPPLSWGREEADGRDRGRPASEGTGLLDAGASEQSVVPSVEFAGKDEGDRREEDSEPATVCGTSVAFRSAEGCRGGDSSGLVSSARRSTVCGARERLSGTRVASRGPL